jgi:hypothetical protein
MELTLGDSAAEDDATVEVHHFQRELEGPASDWKMKASVSKRSGRRILSSCQIPLSKYSSIPPLQAARSFFSQSFSL